MSPLPSQARAVIIGGGIIGCSTAYHLARLGWKEVVLVERHKLTMMPVLITSASRSSVVRRPRPPLLSGVGWQKPSPAEVSRTPNLAGSLHSWSASGGEMAMRNEDLADKGAQAGRTAGTFAGMLSGARLGNLAIPVPILGTFVGGVVGGVIGSEVGQRVGRAVVNGAEAFWTTLQPAPATGDRD